MKISIAHPTLTLGGSSVQADSWQVGLKDADEIDTDLASWDYLSTVHVYRRFQFNPERMFSELGLEQPALSLVIRKGTGYGRLPREVEVIHRSDIKLDMASTVVDLQIKSDRLAGSIWLLSDIILSEVPYARGPLSPSRVGTRVWTDSHHVRLETDAQRFPTEILKFSQQFPLKPWVHAPWILHWNGMDAEQELSNAIRLFINADREESLKRIESLEPLIIQAMMADVMGQVVEYVGLSMDQPDEDLLSEGSIGAQAIYWRELAFGQMSVAEIRSLLERRPGEFRAAVLAAAESKE